MRTGDFAAAWAIADRDLARLCKEGPPKHEGPRHLQRIWRGEPLAGQSVLVRCYHGLGDTIQFARFLPALKGIAREVTVWCQPNLVGMIARVPGVDRVMALHDGTPEVPFDVDIEIMELPHALRAGRDLVHVRCPYLTAASAQPAARARDGACTVGLVWRVGDWDKRREVPASALRSLALPGVQLFSLQREAPASDIAGIGAVDISTSDVEILASRLQTLDLVISVDTMVAHLAAALGRETWVMLHADCDWRWPATGSRTYWYPHARLFRQHRMGDWSSVIAELTAALQARFTAPRRASLRRSTAAQRSAVPAEGLVAATEDNRA
ncbi:hypothetical protein [Bradyrhizobium sp. STM 3557]|uniref:hypothetical protein n=1 Tax=Bradyrhizobium sp. STM 3557 TaxID=578920 RepID=UPI00388E2608